MSARCPCLAAERRLKRVAVHVLPLRGICQLLPALLLVLVPLLLLVLLEIIQQDALRGRERQQIAEVREWLRSGIAAARWVGCATDSMWPSETGALREGRQHAVGTARRRCKAGQP